MQTELVQLLQHEDVNNVKLGCILARAAGYSDVEIIDNMYKNGKFELVKNVIEFIHISFGDNLTFRMFTNDFKWYDFRVWSYKIDFEKTSICKLEKYNETKAEYSTTFIDMIINR